MIGQLTIHPFFLPRFHHQNAFRTLISCPPTVRRFASPDRNDQSLTTTEQLNSLVLLRIFKNWLTVYSNGNADMQNEGGLIDSALLSDVDGKGENVDEVFFDEGFSAILEGAMESESTTELISPEDLAWVDSCLAADLELSMENWVSLKEALLDGITSFADSYEENNAAGPDEKLEVDEKELLGQPEIVDDEGDAAFVQTLLDGTEGDDRDDNEEVEKIQTEIESPESIFRVWDLREEEEEMEDELIPELTRAVADLRVVKEEEDQVLTELKQAIAESILRDKQREAINEASGAEDAELLELISSMADLSLKLSSK